MDLKLKPRKAPISLASGSTAFAKTTNNARMAKEGMEENIRHNEKSESVAVSQTLQKGVWFLS